MAIAEQMGRRILYTMSSSRDGTKDADGKDNFLSKLWRVDYTQPVSLQVQAVDLNQEVLDLRSAEVFDLACDKSGRIYISFDASKQAPDLNTQRARGILRFQMSKLGRKMLPANGKTPDHHNLGLTIMEMDGHEYLIGTIEELSNNENQEIYVAEAETGRGLFKFDAPLMTGVLNMGRRLAYGAGVLWVGERREGPDQVQRVVIRDNVYEPLVSYKRPRRIQITITSEALCSEGEDCGSIIHNLGHPLRNDIKPSQGSYFEGYSLQLESPVSPTSIESDAKNSSIRNFSYSPLNDPSSSGHVTQVRYPASSKDHGIYKTVFQEDF